MVIVVVVAVMVVVVMIVVVTCAGGSAFLMKLVYLLCTCPDRRGFCLVLQAEQSGFI